MCGCVLMSAYHSYLSHICDHPLSLRRVEVVSCCDCEETVLCYELSDGGLVCATESFGVDVPTATGKFNGQPSIDEQQILSCNSVRLYVH